MDNIKRKFPKSRMANTNVYLFIPNLIGYVRIVLLFVAFYYMPFDPYKGVGAYMISQLLDAFDGYAARKFNQSTMFGAVMDMVTDRVSTMGLSFILAIFYTQYFFAIVMMSVLDIVSHWIQMYCSLVCGEQSHKETSNPILKIYYTNRIVLFLMCAGNELFYLMAYLQYFLPGPYGQIFFNLGLWQVLFYVCAPVFLLKQTISFVQLITACQRLVEKDLYNRQKVNQPS